MRYWKPKAIPGGPKVGIAVATWLSSEYCHRADLLRCTLAAFRAQTYKNFEILVVHDGPHPHDAGMKKYVEEITADPRVRMIETPERKKNFGHPHRQMAINELRNRGCEWIGLANDDNYYVPVYFEALLMAAYAKPIADFAYCDMVLSHKMWKPLATELRRGKIDVGGFLVRASLTKKIPFDNHSFSGDSDYIQRLAGLGKARTKKVAMTLFVHN